MKSYVSTLRFTRSALWRNRMELLDFASLYPTYTMLYGHPAPWGMFLGRGE